MKFFEIKSKLFYISIFFFGLYPLIPERYESYVPIIFIASSFILFLGNYKSRPFLWALLIMSLLFLTFLVSGMLSENKYLGLKKLETMLSLIGFPIACFLFLRNVKLDFYKIEKLFFSLFFISNVVYSLIALYLLNFYRNPKFSSKDADFFRNAIADIPYIGDHSIYISLFISIAIIMGTFIYRYKKANVVIKASLLLGQIILATLLLLIMSKAVIIALIFSFLAQYLLRFKVSLKTMTAGLLIILSFFLLLPKQNNRFTELLNKESFEKVDVNNSTSIRFYILKCSINLVLDKPFFGYGLGDVQGVLDSCYAQNGVKLPIGKYNSHNQYLFVWLSSGLIGLIVFLSSLIYVFVIARKGNDFFLISVLFLFIITFLFENVLSRQSGVILFAFLINFLILKNLVLMDKIKSIDRF